jgi:pimeloyl-ACP methyl ester carboxylesterase
LGDCPVAFISPGYEGTADAYSFLAKALNEVGFLVIGVQHELSTDTPMPLGGDIQTVRSPYWRQGAASLAFLLSELPKTYGGFNWKNVVLIGHSNGGDISALFAKEHPRRVAALVTLDNRRIALPRDPTPRTLTIRSSDQQADSGVIPTLDELAVSRTCIVPIVGAQHNDMHDGGPLDLRLKIQAVVVQFLQHAECRYE